ncbi:hypothetical protein M3Y98_00074500 [Aphelenchoides besseyi]|nr:hypothetical protein M3Y98_00074500 [Aphelenchoides besseyi]
MTCNFCNKVWFDGGISIKEPRIIMQKYSRHLKECSAVKTCRDQLTMNNQGELSVRTGSYKLPKEMITCWQSEDRFMKMCCFYIFRNKDLSTVFDFSSFLNTITYAGNVKHSDHSYDFYARKMRLHKLGGSFDFTMIEPFPLAYSNSKYIDRMEAVAILLLAPKTNTHLEIGVLSTMSYEQLMATAKDLQFLLHKLYISSVKNMSKEQLNANRISARQENFEAALQFDKRAAACVDDEATSNNNILLSQRAHDLLTNEQKETLYFFVKTAIRECETRKEAKEEKTHSENNPNTCNLSTTNNDSLPSLLSLEVCLITEKPKSKKRKLEVSTIVVQLLETSVHDAQHSRTHKTI